MRGQQTEADRIAELERDPQCSQFDAHRCLCAACGRWVHLSGRAHKIFNWRRHKKGCTLQKARGAITIIQSKSPHQRTLLNDGLDDGIRMDVDDELEKGSVYTDDGYYDAPPSPNTSHSSISNKSGSDKRYLQLPSITTFALSPTSTSTPPLTCSDAASCSTTTSESGHSLISSWCQSHAPYAPGVSQMGSWSRASHRPRGASTSSFRSLPPLSASSSATVTSTAGSPSIHYFRARGAPSSHSYVSCEGCQTRLEAQEWGMHKRSCRAYGRTQHAQIESDRGYHHAHSVSQPTTILPPVITTTSPIDEPSHVKFIHQASAGGVSIEILNAGSYKRAGDVDTAAREALLRSRSAQGHTYRHSPPRLSIDTSFSRASGARHLELAAESKKMSLTAGGDGSHIGLPDSYRRSHDSHHVSHLKSVQSRGYGDGYGRVDHQSLGRYSDGIRPSSRASSQAEANHSPTSTKSSSGRSSLKIADLCHPSPPRSPDSEQRSRSSSPIRARSWSRSHSQYRYPTRPSYQQHPSSEDNSTTPTHTPLIRTSTSDNAGSRLAALRSAVPYHHSSYELEDTSRQVRYSYSQSRSTFQSEPDSVLSDSDYDSEDERDDKFRRRARRSPLRSLSPPSPYISDA